MLTYLKTWLTFVPEREKGSVTIENIVWAIAVIAIAAIVIAAITGYVTSHSAELLGP